MDEPTQPKSGVPPGLTLARLVEASLHTSEGWGPADYGAILSHQLDCPIRDALPGLPGEASATVTGWCESRRPPVASLRELVADPAPYGEVLRLVKEWAKRSGAPKVGVLPAEVAGVLYHLCIAVALVKCGERVSRLDTTELKAGFEWALRRRWLPPDVQELFRAGLQALETAR